MKPFVYVYKIKWKETTFGDIGKYIVETKKYKLEVTLMDMDGDCWKYYIHYLPTETDKVLICDKVIYDKSMTYNQMYEESYQSSLHAAKAIARAAAEHDETADIITKYVNFRFDYDCV